MMMMRRCTGGQEQQPLWRRRHLVAWSTIRILSRTTIRTPGCKRNAQTPAPFRRRGKGHVRKERVRWYQQSADFVGVLRVLFSRRFFVWRRLVFARGEKLFRKRLLLKTAFQEEYGVTHLRVCITYSKFGSASASFSL